MTTREIASAMARLAAESLAATQLDPAYATYEKRTSRRIAVVVLEPQTEETGADSRA